jgi:putative integral membrane protein (TIGR02587 family)
VTATDRVLRNQVRGVTGALVVSGVTILLTVEMWWLAWQRPASHLIVYAVVGLGIVLFITRSSGFRVEEEDEDNPEYDIARLTVNFAELVLQSVFAAVVVLFVYGVLDLASSLHVVARAALLQVVPLGFGAALANRLLHEAEDDEEDSAEQQSLRANVAIFAAGAIFFSLPLGASIEVNVLAANAGWPRLAAIVSMSLVMAYLILYELEFRGQSRRRSGERKLREMLTHVGQTCIVYAVGVAVSALLLWGFGYLTYSATVDVQKIVVLSFPTTVGGAAARVIL